MLAFPEWWDNLLTANGFIPHGHCYLWKPGLVWLHVASDSLIALAYIAISATLAFLVYKTRQKIPFHWMFLAFGTFIIACGSTHFMDVWTLWHPTYWLAGALKALTAIASVTTATVLPCLVPRALALIESARLSEERRLHLEAANNRLASLNDQLQTVDQLKTQFFANVSHELRTPLALILGPVEKLLKQDLNQDSHRDLELVNRNARLLLKQVNDLLDVSKLEAGRMALNPAPVDLPHLIRLTAANFDGLAEEKQITFLIETPESLPTELDAAKTQRILLNLLSNAFKFTPSGGIVRCTLEVSQPAAQPPAASETAIDAKTPPQRAVISIQDSGSGIPVELRQTIFERFNQGEGGTTRRFGGTGLGLAIVKEFVELQGGTIQVGDAPEGGAKFTLELPLRALATAALPAPSSNLEQSEEMAGLMIEELRSRPPHPTPSQEQNPEKPLVLVVEDNPEMNQFIVNALAPDYRTATAADGQTGLQQALVLQPDLILSDVMMPQMGGDQLVQQLRTYPELDNTPVVMLTAKTDDELRVQLLRGGAQDYLMKPFSLEELRARVGNLIAIKRLRDLLQQELASQNHNLEALVQEVSLRRRELQLALHRLQRQAEELEQANRLKDEFLAIVSHELRTPLNAILGWANALQTRKFSETVTARALETIERNARLQTQLIENLLLISRLSLGNLLLDKRSVDLRPVIEAALQIVQPGAAAKAIHLQADLDPAVGPIHGDSDRLRQVIENLLSNAVKFTPQSGQIEIRLAQQDDSAIIQVKDTGEGIPADMLPHIFDDFRQADSSTTRKHGGLGLGLAIVRQLVELHGGQIRAESQGKGQGATFTVTLPLQVTSTPPLYLR
ncbi:MAG: ATP-binding protein [Elainella sp.]